MTEAESYLAEVRAALADLPAAERDDLLEDLPGHLAETQAETGGLAGLGTPQAYAAELRASAGLPGPTGAATTSVRTSPLGSAAAGFADGVADRVDRVRRWAADVPYGPQVLAFLPELRPGWWVLRGYLALAVPASAGVLLSFSSLPPFLSLLGSDALGLLATVAAIVVSVRLGRRSAGLEVRQRQLVVAGNVALAVVALAAAAGLEQRGGYAEQIVYASETGVLQGPGGPISNLYAYDAEGRPLRDVQLFDQDGRPLDSLAVQGPEGEYAEVGPVLDAEGAEVSNVFPRRLSVEVYPETGSFSTGAGQLQEVRPPAIAPRRLASPSPTPTPSPSPSASPSSSADPAASPVPTASPSPAAPAAPAPAPAPTP